MTPSIVIPALMGLAFLLPGTRGTAQVSPDQAVKKILETIDEELAEIDRMLLETSKRNSTGDSGGTDKLKRLMKDTRGSQERVVRGIDQLIEELEKMQNQQGGGGGGQGQQQQGQPQQRSEDPLQDQEQSTRQDSATPESTRNLKPDQKPPQQQGEQGQPSAQENPQQGQNVESAKRPEDGAERVIREADRGKWGELQKYEFQNHLRGGLPEVPEKYRKFLEEYHRKNQRTRSNGANRR